MKKIIFIFVLTISLFGCSEVNTAKSIVEDYLSSYQNLEYQVLVDMEEVVSSESSLTTEQKETYRNILKKQYVDLTYEILEESYENDNATVTVEIDVYDYFSASQNASEYLEKNLSEFYDDNNEFSSELYMEYKLSLYSKITDKKSYVIEFNLIKEDNIWKILTIDNEVLEKIHGIYNYELDLT